MPNIIPDDEFDTQDEQEAPVNHAAIPQPIQPKKPVPAKPTDAFKPKPSEPREVTLEDGRTVILQKPSRPVSLFLARIMGKDSTNSALLTYYKAMLWVRNVGGIDIPNITDESGFNQLNAILGDEGLDEVVYEVFVGFEAQDGDELDKAQAKN